MAVAVVMLTFWNGGGGVCFSDVLFSVRVGLR